MTSVDLAAPVTHEAFARLVGLSRQQVTDLVVRGVLDRGGSLGDWILAYTSRLRDEAGGRSAAHAQARARLERLRSDHQEMRNRELERSLVPADLLHRILANTGQRIAAVLDRVPANVARDVPALDPAAAKLLREEIDRARLEALALEFPLDSQVPR